MELHRVQGDSWMFLLLLLLLGSFTISCAQLELPANCGLQQQGGQQQQLCSFFFRQLEDAFVNDVDIPFQLQKLFFPVGRLPSLQVDVYADITLDNVPNIRCTELRGTALSQGTASPTYEFEHRWIRSIISFVIEREELVFLEAVNFVAYAASFFNHIDFSRESIEFPDNISLVDLSGGDVQFNIHIQNLSCIPEESVLLEAWEDILPWLQLYARNRGGIDQFDEEDRGYPVRIGAIADINDSDAPLEAGLLLPVLTVVHILLIIIIALIVMRFITAYSKETLTSNPKSPAISIYWANVFMSVFAAIGIVSGNLFLYLAETAFIEDRSSRAFAFQVTSDVTTTVLVVLELVAAIITPKCTCSVHIPVPITHVLCCYRCCNRCATKNRAKKLSWFVQTLALWVQMVFLQLAAAAIVPVILVCLRNPTPTIAFATLMAAVYFCLVIFIAHFIQLMRGGKDTQSSSLTFSLLLQAAAFLVFLGIVACVVVVYLRFVQAGSGSSSVTGVVLSLIPTIGIAAVSWFAKKQLLSEETEDEASNGNSDSQTGIAKYVARFRKTISGKTTAKQRLTSVPNEQSAVDTESHNTDDTEKVSLNVEPSASNGQSADDAESLNDTDATEKVSLNIEPDVTATPHSIEIRFMTVDFQPTEPEDGVIANPTVVDTNI